MIANITPNSIQPPKPDKKSGIIIDTEGKTWHAKPDILNRMEVGKTYPVDYFTNEFNNKIYSHIKEIKDTESPNQAAVPAQGNAIAEISASLKEMTKILKGIGLVLKAKKIEKSHEQQDAETQKKEDDLPF